MLLNRQSCCFYLSQKNVRVHAGNLVSATLFSEVYEFDFKLLVNYLKGNFKYMFRP